MPESTKDYVVLAHFRVKDDDGNSVVYDPDGAFDPKTGKGWGEGPKAARKSFRGDPNSDQVKDLLAGAGGIHGPLIAEKGSDDAKAAAAATPGKEN